MSYLCEICGGVGVEVYNGDIRDGAYGGIKSSAVIYECSGCGVQRLREVDCIPDEYYETGKYREKLKESLDGLKAVVEQDENQYFTMQALFPNSLRDKTILDVGCGVGSLLDMLKNISGKQIGVEPCTPYLESLIERGYQVYSDLSLALKEHSNAIDYAFSIQVIEHVKNPRKFLKEFKKFLAPGGKLLISTPNRNDILMTLLKEIYFPFFYRTQHRWYFDENSLINCAKIAGLRINNVKYIHRYGMANIFYWLRDNQPRGRLKMKGIDTVADTLWKSYLESTKQSDNMYLELMVDKND
jgi:2-polyprenyl-3-methyl-5-hydroxy-6-metoxy-1,4-benzoquinol methylase